ncbi:hypothetical protein F2Q70_00019890 [Brassica cretica]|uniref:Fucosyltransferase n=1 Tax=Brassica cretica TaxID=69181 RepID=A0A8S9GND4_BRACR|nr:hypothetical protein F2Q70_00019890 [Brassica cretica]
MKMKLLLTVGTCLVLWSVMLVSFSNVFKHHLLGAIVNGSNDSDKPRDKLLEGLLTADFDEDSCLSRYQSSLYRKPSPYKPSQYLVSKLRSYEKLHQRCGPDTEAYKQATKNLGHDDENYANKSVGECKYIVSTFGYVAHSLGGLKPWLLYQPKDFKAPDPPCIRSTSIDPCHLTPPSHGCDADWGTYSGKVVPFVRECEDREHDGIKLFDEL